MYFVWNSWHHHIRERRAAGLRHESARKMCDALIHRGPDDETYFSNTNVQLGMTRLAILDLRKGLCPLRNEDGRLPLFYNDEIYNFTELTEKLSPLKDHKQLIMSL